MTEEKTYLRLGSLAIGVIFAVIGVVFVSAGGAFQPNAQGGYWLRYTPTAPNQLEPIGLLFFVIAIVFISVFYFWPSHLSPETGR